MIPPRGTSVLASVFLSLHISVGFAETVKDRKAAVLDDRAKMQEDNRWIYNDWQRGFSAAFPVWPARVLMQAS